MRAVTPSVQAEADTSSASERTWCDDQSPAASLSSISRSAVAASGTRSSASASTMRASPPPGGQRIGVEEILDPAEAAGVGPDALDEAPRIRVDLPLRMAARLV